MSVLFSTIAFFGIIITVAAGVVWVVSRVRHRETKARVVCIAAAVVAVASFVAFGVTHEPIERADAPTAEDAPQLDTEPEEPAADPEEPVDAPDATPEPSTMTPEPSTPDPEPSAPAPEEPPQQPDAATEPPADDPKDTAPTPAEKPLRSAQDALAPSPIQTPAPAPEKPAEAKPDPVEQAKKDIEKVARQIVTEHYTSTDVDRVTVNEDYGTDVDGDYVLLMYLTWNVKNSAKLTNEVLAMYSEDFAARVGTDLENVEEVALFWTVPYYNEKRNSAKYSYERRGSGMYESDRVSMIR